MLEIVQSRLQTKKHRVLRTKGEEKKYYGQDGRQKSTACCGQKEMRNNDAPSKGDDWNPLLFFVGRWGVAGSVPPLPHAQMLHSLPLHSLLMTQSTYHPGADILTVHVVVVIFRRAACGSETGRGAVQFFSATTKKHLFLEFLICLTYRNVCLSILANSINRFANNLGMNTSTQNEGAEDEWEDRKPVKILNHHSHAPLQRSPNPNMPWPPWDRELNTNSRRDNRYAFATVGDHQYPPPSDHHPQSSYLFEHSRPDPLEPYPRYERYADRGGDMETEGNPPGPYQRRAVFPYDNGCYPAWRHEQQANHRWRTAERSSSWEESSPNRHRRQTYPAADSASNGPHHPSACPGSAAQRGEQLQAKARGELVAASTGASAGTRAPCGSRFKEKPAGLDGHETDEMPHPSYSAVPRIPSVSPHEEAAGPLTPGSVLWGANPPALAAATRTPPIGCSAEPAPPPLIVRAGPSGPLSVPGAHPGIDRALCEAVARICQHGEQDEGGGSRSGGFPGKRDRSPAASRAEPGMPGSGKNGVVLGGRSRHGAGGSVGSGPNPHEVAKFIGHMAERCGGRREELTVNPPGTQAEVETVLPGIEASGCRAVLAVFMDRELRDLSLGCIRVRPSYFSSDP